MGGGAGIEDGKDVIIYFIVSSLFSVFSLFFPDVACLYHCSKQNKTKPRESGKIWRYTSATQNISDQKALPCWGVHLICRFTHRETGADYFQLKGSAASLLRFISSDTPLKHLGEGGDQTFQVGRNAVWCCSQCLQALAPRLLDPICSEQQHMASNHRGIFREWAMCACRHQGKWSNAWMNGWMNECRDVWMSNCRMCTSQKI